MSDPVKPSPPSAKPAHLAPPGGSSVRGPASNESALRSLARAIQSCEACPRLRTHCETVAREKRRAFAEWEYWGKPVEGFGDPRARLFLLGLAPAAHGANRTGRLFTGDESGKWLYRALHKAGFASQPVSVSRDDSLRLTDAWIGCAVRCAPPGNKPLPDEYARCRPFLAEELDLLPSAEVYIALGSIALGALEREFRGRDLVELKTKWKFRHGAEFTLRDGRRVLASFHPSQQNTFTKKLTEPMFDAIFARARELLP